MIRATAGTWISYVTTLAFQVVFASRFGTGHRAAAFIITFGIGVAVSSVFISSVRSVALPRLLDAQGRLLAGTIRFLVALALIAFAAALLVGVAAGPLGTLLAATANLEPQLLTDLLRISAVFLFFEFLSGELSAISLARGQRWIPSVAPAFPSTLATIALLLARRPDVRWVFILLVIGSLLQVAFLSTTLLRARRFVQSRAREFGSATLAMLIVFTALTLIPPIERVVAAGYSPAGAAQYDYAMRSLRAVQQLIVGGLLLAALGNWSVVATSGRIDQLRSSFSAAFSLVCALLLCAGSLGLVSAHTLVALMFQHGSFSPGDTDAVTGLILLGLVGFCAEGIGLVITSALVGLKLNTALARIGLLNFSLRLVLIVILGRTFGAAGIALAYSATSAVILVCLLWFIRRLRLWKWESGFPIQRLAVVPLGTAVAALSLALFGQSLPPGISAVAVIATFVALSSRFQITQLWGLLPK